MAKRILDQRVGALEEKGDNLEALHREFPGILRRELREQAELIDRLFILRFDEWGKRWAAKFDAQMDAKLEQKLEPLRTELAALRDDVRVIISKLN